MIGEAQSPPAEATGSPDIHKKSGTASFTCSQCHHLQRNGVFEYSQDGDELSGDAFCGHCGYLFLRLGHSDTFFSMSSQKTEGDMKGYYMNNRNPMSSRKYNDPTFAASVRANASEGGPVVSNSNHRVILVSTSGDPSSRRSRRSNTSSEDDGSPVEDLMPADDYREPANPRLSSRDTLNKLELPTKLTSKRQRMNRIVSGFKKMLFQVGRRPRTENTDHDQRGMDASTNPSRPTWRKRFSLRQREPATPMTVLVDQEGGAVSLVPARDPSTDVTQPRRDESAQGDAATEEQTATVDVDNDEPMPEEDRVDARRNALTAAARAHGVPVVAVPQHRIQAMAEHLPRADAQVNSNSSYQAVLLMGMSGGGDEFSIPRPDNLTVSDLGSPNGSRFQLDGMNWNHESVPSLHDSRRHSGETNTSATLLNSISSPRGSSRGRTRFSLGRSSTLGRSPLSSSPEHRPDSAGESSSGLTASSRRPSGFALAVDTSRAMVNGDANSDSDADDGGPTPRVGRQGIPIDRLAGPRQSISSILDEAEQQRHAQDSTGTND